MKIEIDIPDELARVLAERSVDLSRLALEAFALEGYRSRQLSGGMAQRLLDFETSLQLHAFLKEHGVYLNYSMEDLEQDIKTSDEFLAKRKLQSSNAA
jgi:predicted HTH domain antitoxin